MYKLINASQSDKKTDMINNKIYQKFMYLLIQHHNKLFITFLNIVFMVKTNNLIIGHHGTIKKIDDYEIFDCENIIRVT